MKQMFTAGKEKTGIFPTAPVVLPLQTWSSTAKEPSFLGTNSGGANVEMSDHRVDFSNKDGQVIPPDQVIEDDLELPDQPGWRCFRNSRNRYIFVRFSFSFNAFLFVLS